MEELNTNIFNCKTAKLPPSSVQYLCIRATCSEKFADQSQDPTMQADRICQSNNHPFKKKK
jgi:hypothetical protein